MKPIIERENSVTCDYVEKHPAYGQITVSRISGQSTLYGSDFKHQYFIGISIYGSELQRHLNKDFAFSRDKKVEVWLSEAQWATFVSSVNMGAGVQCTLKYFNGESIPELEKNSTANEIFKSELKSHLEEILGEIDSLSQAIKNTKVSKKVVDGLSSKLTRVKMGLTSSLDFISKQFSEHMEVTIEKAKVEIDAYAQNQLLKAGLEANISKLLEFDDSSD